MKCLNLGCGRRFDHAWTNIDFVSTDPQVIAHDLKQGIPFPDASFEVVYHSHVLEHFPRSAAAGFLRECNRVLRPGGILRVAVPDLEQIVRHYLALVDEGRIDSPRWAADHEWILLEMYDQTVRDRPGGGWWDYLSREHIPNEAFVLERCGMEARSAIESARRRRLEAPRVAADPGEVASHVRLSRGLAKVRELLVRLILGPEYSALQNGRFRLSGEVHQWMYDRWSLRLLLQATGYEHIVQRSADVSYVPSWAAFNLDTEPDGTLYKPDSLFMEAKKRA
jgi:SAM-dependent methyltransferase